jgi:hypothetical protein
MMTGPFILTPSARSWGAAWYESFWKDSVSRMDDQMAQGYAARKQTHIHKVAMVLSASRSPDLVIQEEDLQLANNMLLDIEMDMPKVFSRIGRTEDSMQAERFIDFVKQKGLVTYHEAYKMIHIHFPNFRDFEGILTGAVNSGQICLVNTHQGIMLKAILPPVVSPDTLIA